MYDARKVFTEAKSNYAEFTNFPCWKPIMTAYPAWYRAFESLCCPKKEGLG
ncbi:MAG: hypothetical protein FWD31_09635 [Planctomycetaceae bacterium]|nr:hypothetical protein [Planctomycetaceae bacterium]